MRPSPGRLIWRARRPGDTTAVYAPQSLSRQLLFTRRAQSHDGCRPTFSTGVCFATVWLLSDAYQVALQEEPKRNLEGLTRRGRRRGFSQGCSWFPVALLSFFLSLFPFSFPFFFTFFLSFSLLSSFLSLFSFFSVFSIICQIFSETFVT